jgi:hypothetical protein
MEGTHRHPACGEGLKGRHPDCTAEMHSTPEFGSPRGDDGGDLTDGAIVYRHQQQVGGWHGLITDDDRGTEPLGGPGDVAAPHYGYDLVPGCGHGQPERHPGASRADEDELHDARR